VSEPETKLYESIEGPDGVRVEIWDESAPYAYSNIFWVKLRIVGCFPGVSEPFERRLEKMGVFAEDLEATKRGLVDSFKNSALPYLTRSGFGEKMKAIREKKESPKPKGVGGYRCS
jgi:hypothetical protein